MVAIPGEENNREILFLPEKYQFAGAQFPYDDDRFRDVSWNQPIRRLYAGEDAESRAGIGETYPLDEFAQRLPALVADAGIVFMAQESGSPYALQGLAPPLTEHQQLEFSISELLPRAQIRDASAKILTMRRVKDEHEIAALRRAAEISTMGLNEVLEKLRPGKNDLENAGIMEAVWKREGSPRASLGPIVSSGAAAISLYTLKAEKYHSTDDKLTSAPDELAAIAQSEYLRDAESEGIELVMWLVMRGALEDDIREVHRHYHVPASNTAAGLIVFENG